MATAKKHTLKFKPIESNKLRAMNAVQNAIAGLGLTEARSIVQSGVFEGTGFEVAAVAKAIKPFVAEQHHDRMIAMHRLGNEVQRISDRVIVFVVNKVADVLEKI